MRSALFPDDVPRCQGRATVLGSGFSVWGFEFDIRFAFTVCEGEAFGIVELGFSGSSLRTEERCSGVGVWELGVSGREVRMRSTLFPDDVPRSQGRSTV